MVKKNVVSVGGNEKIPSFSISRKEHERNKGFSRIGLEIHGYIDSDEKLFCTCKAIHGAKYTKPNINICPICTGQPGAKPMLPNSKTIEKAIQISLLLNCKINKKLIWWRKHYDWPDLPKGFQNTISGPYASPVGVGGKFEGIGIRECHLEEDPAAWNPETGEIDYNRSGSPLIEIVTEPDFTLSEQVVEWLKKLLATLSYIKAIDKTSGIKADVNVSTTGERVEIKNVNSLTNIKNSIDGEVKRQEKEKVKIQETRRYDSEKNKTILMRTKENAEDYRFISEPDLPAIKIESSRIDKIKNALPETPPEKLQKLIKKHRIPKKYAEILAKKIDIVEFFERVIEKINPKIAIPWVTIELMGTLNYAKKELDEIELSVEHFIELLQLIEKKIITELKAKEILRKFIPKSFSPKEEAKLQSKISKENDVENFVKQVIKENEKAVADYKSGQQNALNFLIGQVMKISNKRADYKTAREILERILR